MDTIEILVLDNQEHIIGWLNPRLVDVTENNDNTGLQNISLTHPINDDTNNDYDNWLEHGNKIWISETEDLKSCLYIINAEKTIDQDNIIVTADEVLVELNNLEPIESTSLIPITIDETQLSDWFGDLFTIDTLESGNIGDTTTFTSTINPMALFRQIETDTGNYMITRYEKDPDSNIIHRYLDLKQALGITHTVPIEIGENSDKIELEINEDDTYTAMAPIIKGTDTATATDTVTNAQILADFKALAITVGQSIPKTIEKGDDGSETVTEYWNAPFKKDTGSYKVYSEDYTKSSYTHIRGKEASSTILNKTGNVETSESNKYVIYNLCANALKEKLDPVVNITADVSDLRRLHGIEASYCVGEVVSIRLPHRHGLVESTVTDTEKNPRLIGESKITLGNDVTRSYQAQQSIARAASMDTNVVSGIYGNINNKLDTPTLGTSSTSGYIAMANGFKIAWGRQTISCTAGVTHTVNFSFPNPFDGTPFMYAMMRDATNGVMTAYSSSQYTGNIVIKYNATASIQVNWLTIGV